MQGLLFICSCLACVSCLSLGGEVLFFENWSIFNVRKRFTVFSHSLPPASFPHTSHSLPLSLSLPSSWGAGGGERHSWVPDAKCFSQGCSPSWTCYWLALPKSNGIADRCCKTPPTCSGSKFSYNVCAWAGTRGFLMCSPILITAVASKARGMASFIANSCFLSSNCVCGSVQPQRGFWQLAGAAAFPLLSCDN